MEPLVYNCLINENSEDATGIYAISFVDCPANEVDFIALRMDNDVYLSKNEKKQILTGVVLRPEQPIYRYSPQSGEYYIKFSAEEIEKISRKMMRTGVALRNTTHQHESPLSGNYLTELWIVENPENDKSNALGFKDLPKGTLMCSYKVENKDYWEKEVMSGNVKGFSLEGFFEQQIAMSANRIKSNKKRSVMNKPKKKKEHLLMKFFKALLDIDEVETDDTTDSGTPYVIFVLADGKEVYVDEDGFATLDGEQMPAGEHNLANGKILVINEEGQFVETKEPSSENDEPSEATGAQTLSKKSRTQLNEIARKQKATNMNSNKPNRVKMEEVEPESIESLKAKIAELEAIIVDLKAKGDEAETKIEEAVAEVEELKNKRPSATPAVQTLESQRKYSEMSNAERMAVALSQAVNRRKK